LHPQACCSSSFDLKSDGRRSPFGESLHHPYERNIAKKQWFPDLNATLLRAAAFARAAASVDTCRGARAGHRLNHQGYILEVIMIIANVTISPTPLASA
jgi:hypothetical protein